MIAGGSIERDAKLAHLATLAGCMPISMDEDQPADFLLADLSSETDRLSDFLSRITIYLQTHHSTALIWAKMEALEYVYAALPHGQCHFLVDADDIEAMPILAGVFGRAAWIDCMTETTMWNLDRYTGSAMNSLNLPGLWHAWPIQRERIR